MVQEARKHGHPRGVEDLVHFFAKLVDLVGQIQSDQRFRVELGLFDVRLVPCSKIVDSGEIKCQTFKGQEYVVFVPGQQIG